MLDVEEPEVEQAFERSAPAPEMYEPPVETPQPVEADYAEIPEEPSKQAEWRGPEDPLDRPTQGWPRLASWIVPIIFFVYVLISIFTNR